MNNTIKDTGSAAPDAAGREELLHIPPTVLVPCPLALGPLTRLDKCPACPHWAGLAKRFEDSAKKPFAVQYLLRCKSPRVIPLQEVLE